MAGPARLVSCHTDSLHRQTSLAVLTKVQCNTMGYKPRPYHQSVATIILCGCPGQSQLSTPTTFAWDCVALDEFNVCTFRVRYFLVGVVGGSGMVSTPNGEASTRGYQVGTLYPGPMGMQLLLLSVWHQELSLWQISPPPLPRLISLWSSLAS